MGGQVMMMSELDFLIYAVKNYEMDPYTIFGMEEIKWKKQRIREIESKTKT